MYSCCGSLTVAVPNFMTKFLAVAVVARPAVNTAVATIVASRELALIAPSPLDRVLQARLHRILCASILEYLIVQYVSVKHRHAKSGHVTRGAHAFRRDQRLCGDRRPQD